MHNQCEAGGVHDDLERAARFHAALAGDLRGAHKRIGVVQIEELDGAAGSAVVALPARDHAPAFRVLRNGQ